MFSPIPPISKVYYDSPENPPKKLLAYGPWIMEKYVGYVPVVDVVWVKPYSRERHTYNV
jgi:hypothetical protein